MMNIYVRYFHLIFTTTLLFSILFFSAVLYAQNADSSKINNDSTLIYTVKPGDNLWNIARDKLLNPFLWIYIFEANKELIKHPDIIFPDQKFKLSKTFPSGTLVISTLPVVPQIKQAEMPTKENLAEPDALDNDLLYETGNIENDSETDLNGMIIDDTISKIGRDFIQFFNSSWHDPGKKIEYNITVQEKPYPGNGSLILVYVNDYIVFKSFVQPRYDVVEENSDNAIQMAYTYLENYDLILQQIQGDDLSGTGIY